MQVTEKDLDIIDENALKLLSYLEISQIYLSYCSETEGYSAMNLLDLIDEMIIMARTIVDKF